MALSQEAAIIIGCIVGITVLIIFGLILWYFFSKNKPPKTYDKIEQSPKDIEANDETNNIHPLTQANKNQIGNATLLTVGQDTKRLLDMDSNNVFANRWSTDENTIHTLHDIDNQQINYQTDEKALETQTRTETIKNIETKESEKAKTIDNIIQFPTRCENAPISDPQPISDKYPTIDTPSEVLLPFNDSDWQLFETIYQKYGDKLNGLYPDDLTRFVQGYCHEQEREKETFKRINDLLQRGFSYSEFPNEWDFHNILNEPMPDNEEEECLKTWPVFMYGYDKCGHPIMYDEIGCSNPADLDKCFDGKLRKLRTFRFRLLRRLHNTKRIQTMRYGYDGSVNDKGGLNAITKQNVVMNMKNFYAKALTAKYRNLVKDIIGDESNLWPNTLERMFIINAPWPFRFAWKVVSQFIHPVTVEKIKILDGSYIDTMKEYIDLNQIPKEYGGSGELPIKYGYTADIDNDILDGDYCKQGDPIDLETVYCRKNNITKLIIGFIRIESKINNVSIPNHVCELILSFY